MIKIMDILDTINFNFKYEDTLFQTILYYAAKDNRPLIVKWLNSRDLNPNHLDKYNQTPLY